MNCFKRLFVPSDPIGKLTVAIVLLKVALSEVPRYDPEELLVVQAAMLRHLVWLL